MARLAFGFEKPASLPEVPSRFALLVNLKLLHLSGLPYTLGRVSTPVGNNRDDENPYRSLTSRIRLRTRLPFQRLSRGSVNVCVSRRDIQLS